MKIIVLLATLFSISAYAASEAEVGTVKAVQRTLDFQIDDLVRACVLDFNKIVNCNLNLFPINGTELLVSITPKYVSVRMPGTPNNIVQFAFSHSSVTAIYTARVTDLVRGKELIAEGYQLSTLTSKSPTAVLYLVK